jgi:hypothetical protein
MVETPADLHQHVAHLYDGHIVWSRRGNLHQVRYGLQVATFEPNEENVIELALNELASCIRHYAEREGLLD